MALAFSTAAVPIRAVAQDQGNDQDDPPTRVARIGYLQGSVSFQPAGEDEWVDAVPNRPMTTGDKIWTDKDSRAELQLGSAVIRLTENTGFSFLNLDDNTVQIQLTSGSIIVRVRRLNENDDVEVDTPNLAFTVSSPGFYRVGASEDGTNTTVVLRDGASGQATGNGQTYTVHDGQSATFSGTDSLNADVEQAGGRDQFGTWSYERDGLYDHSRSAQYLSADVVGYEDLDANGDWRDDPSYGHVWFPNRVEVGWAPYHTGHWDWIEPWGYTWVDDSAWGYAPFHYGRWVTVGGRWGWVAGPVAVRAVYAPALVVFVGGGVGVGFGGNVGWFPLGPREVFVPTYHVSAGYMTRVNISNTTVTNVQVTNIYNTTIVNRTTNITNVTYVNRGVQGAVMVVPQHAFASAQPVARVAVKVDAAQIASAPINARVAVVPTREAVLGAKAASAGHVNAPPAAVMNRQVVAKRTPPPPPVPFAKQQQALAAHPGQPLARSEVRTLAPAATAATHPMVKQAPPGKPATPTTGHPNRPGNQQNAARPGQPGGQPNNQPANSRPMNNQPTNTQPANAQPANNQMNRPANQQNQNERPGAANPAPSNRAPAAEQNRPQTNQPGANRAPAAEQTRPAPNNRPETTAPAQPPAKADRPPSAQPNNRPNPTNNEANRPAEPPARNERPNAAPANNRPEATRPESERPAPRTAPAPAERTQQPTQQRTTPPAETRTAPPARQQPKAQTPAEKKQEEEQRKKEQKPPNQ